MSEFYTPQRGQTELHEAEPNESATLLIVRHAQAEHNVPGQSHHTHPNPKLTELGNQQAHALGEAWKKKGFKIDAAVTSGKPRTDQTAAAILEAAGNSLTIHTDDRLRERDNGVKAHLLGENTNTVSDELTARLYSLPDNERWDYLPTDIAGLQLDHYETERIAAERFENALHDIAGAHPGQTVLVVSHEMAMKAHLAAQLEQARTSNNTSVFKNLHVKNTGYYVLEMSGKSTNDAEAKSRLREQNLNGASKPETFTSTPA